MTFRKTLFWIHLIAGVVSGLSIGIMCFTGTVLAFEKELVAWAERDARRVDIPAAGATRLPLDVLQRKLKDAHPDARPTAIVMQNDPNAARAEPDWTEADGVSGDCPHGGTERRRTTESTGLIDRSRAARPALRAGRRAENPER